LHSPAVTGGGVSDNPLKDAMREMQQQGMGGDLPSSGGEEPKKKKDKKKGKGKG
jgi:signal recognition particle subunit SRP19